MPAAVTIQVENARQPIGFIYAPTGCQERESYALLISILDLPGRKPVRQHEASTRTCRKGTCLF